MEWECNEVHSPPNPSLSLSREGEARFGTLRALLLGKGERRWCGLQKSSENKVFHTWKFLRSMGRGFF